jgi:hypothetical protein
MQAKKGQFVFYERKSLGVAGVKINHRQRKPRTLGSVPPNIRKLTRGKLEMIEIY